jgi:TPR repeat protein
MKQPASIKIILFLAGQIFACAAAANAAGDQIDWAGELTRAEAALKGRPAAPGNPLLVPDIRTAREILQIIVRQAPVSFVASACAKLLPILDEDEPETRARCTNAGKETGKTGLFAKAARSDATAKSNADAADGSGLQLLQAALANGDFKAALALSRRPDIDPKTVESYRKQAEMLALRQAAKDPSASIFVDQQTILEGNAPGISEGAWKRLYEFAAGGSREAALALRDIGRKTPAAAARAALGIFAAARAGNADAAQMYVAAHVDDKPVWTDRAAASELAALLAQTGRTLDLVVALQFSIRNGDAVTVEDIGKRILQSAQGDPVELLRAAWRLEETKLATPSELMLAFQLAERAAREGNLEAASWAPLLIEQHPDIAGDGRWEKAVALLETRRAGRSLNESVLLAKLKLAHPSGNPDLAGARAALEAIPGETRTAVVWQRLGGIAAEDPSASSGKEAAALYGKAIKLGSAEAMIDLATILLAGRPGIAADPTTAQRLLDDAAATGQTEAMLKLAKAVTAREPNEARYLYLKALENGDARAGVGLSALLENSGDIIAARKALEKAAVTGDPEMIASLAAFLLRTKSADASEIEKMLEPIVSARDISSSAQILAASTLLQLSSSQAQGRALNALKALAQKEEPDAVAALAKHHVSVAAAGADGADAERWARKASKLHRPSPLVDLAKWYLQSDAKQQQRKAADLLTAVLESNPSQTDANRLLGDMLAQGVAVKRDMRAAFAKFEAAALAGSVGGQLRLARAYETGSGTELDTAKAIKFYSQAAESGSLTAMRDLGRLLVSDGPNSDPMRGFQILYTAAKAGQVESQTEIGRLLLSGVGMLHDEAEGLRWLEKGAKGGDPSAMIDLFHHFRRNGSDSERRQAISMLQKAATGGSKEAMSILAAMYRDGDLVEADQQLAQMWFTKAADQGDLKAARASKRLNKKIAGKN